MLLLVVAVAAMADDIDVTRSLIDQRATDDIDVLVLGAGIAGLAAAAALREHGLSVLLVEGRDRIGEANQDRLLQA